MSITTIRVGEIGLHIMQANQMDDEKWISFFKSEEEVQEASNDTEGFIYRLPDVQAQLVRKRLTTALEYFVNGISTEKLTEESDSKSHYQNLSKEHAQDIVSTVQVDIIETDKGSFHNMNTWVKKLGVVYKHIEGFPEIFAMACLQAKVDPTITYISETKKKSINGHILQCSNDHIEKLSNQI